MEAENTTTSGITITIIDLRSGCHNVLDAIMDFHYDVDVKKKDSIETRNHSAPLCRGAERLHNINFIVLFQRRRYDGKMGM